MVQHSIGALQRAGYSPYYLYRQKGTLQNLENTGWAKPGFAGLYNIYIMEEVHTILSAGAGGSTKLVGPAGRIERVFNHKYPLDYLNHFDEVLARKQKIEDFYGKWFDLDSKRLVELGLLNVAAQLPQKFVEYCEQDYAARVQQAAVQVRQSGARVVMLTGPSSSGKTTTAHKLAAAPARRRVESAVVSLDNFFKTCRITPRLPDGRPDYESVDALDIPAILRALASLIETGRAEIPDFDFNREQRVCGTLEVSVGRGVAVVEGIHALNPCLVAGLPAGSVYKGVRGPA